MKPRRLPVALVLAAGLAAAPLANASNAFNPDTQAVEFFNLDLDHYFITASASEALAIDSGAAGPGWTRTGRSFGVWLGAANAPAGSAAVCRFYSSGANSHFFTASAAECASLKAQEAAERRQSSDLGRVFTGWTFEGVAFTAMAPAVAVAASIAGAAKAAGGACPSGTEDVFRAYNDGFANGRGANHRFVNDATLRTLMEDRGWISEGVAFCAPVQSSGTSAPSTPATGSFPELATTWSDTATWEFEAKPGGAETETRAALSLAITNAGAITGTGLGCALAGNVVLVDGFRTLYEGDVTATGCTDPRFSVAYGLTIERLGTGQLQLHLRNETTSSEAHVDALLSSEAPPSVPTPPVAGVATTWVGTVAWVATTKSGGGGETTLAAVNQSLTLTIDGSTLAGSGFGCAFAGTLQGAAGGIRTGTITATGCTQSVFDGTYVQVDLHPEDGAALEVELEREVEAGGASTKVKIRGVLHVDGNAAVEPPPVVMPPVTPPSGFTLAGTWVAADASWSVEIRVGKNPSQIASGTHPLSLTIGTDNAVAGDGFGCAFTGTASAVSGLASTFVATLVASGCTDAAFNGAYANVGLHAEDGALDVEVEREVEVSDTRTKVRIDALLRKP